MQNNDQPKKSEMAKNLFTSGYNCAQSVLVTFKDEFNLPEKDLLKIASGFGAGMGRLQETCGAVTGAYMAIGLKYGQHEKENNEAREKTYHLIQKFDAEFKEIHGTTNCGKLLGCNLMTVEGSNHFKENNLKEKVCSVMVADAVNIMESILKNK